MENAISPLKTRGDSREALDYSPKLPSGVFFANAQRIADLIRPLVDEATPSVVLLDFSVVSDLEYSALKMLIEAEEQARREGRQLWLAALNPGVLDVVARSKLGDCLGRERIFVSLEAAVEKYAQMKSARANP